MSIPIPQSKVGLSSKLYRKNPNENIVVMEHTVKVTSGRLLEDLVLVKPLLDTSGTVNGSLYPVREHYDVNLGIYYSEFEIVESSDTDVLNTYTFTGGYRSLELEEDLQFKESVQLSLPEPAPHVVSASHRVEDNKFIITYVVRRKNGKIPKSVYLPEQASKRIGLLTGKLINQQYDRASGVIVGTYLVGSNVRFLELDFKTEIYLGETVPSTEVGYKGTEEVIRSLKVKVLCRTLKKNIMSVVLGVKWNDTGTPPTDLTLITPFLVGTNVPSGTVDPKSISYNPVNGTYFFDIKVKTISEGKLEYSFATKGKSEGYPEVPISINFDYNHQKTYTSKLVNVTLRENKLSAEWEILNAENPNYRLENFSVAPLDLGIGLDGNSRPEATWLKGNKTLITTWTVNNDNSQEQDYIFRGHFLADNKQIPWTLQVKALPIGMTTGKVVRLDSNKVGFAFTLITNGKIKDVNATDLTVLVNGIPTSKKIVQDINKDTSIVSGYFDLPEQTDNKADISLIGYVTVDDGTLRYIPVVVYGKDYLPSPLPTSGVQAELISHVVEESVEKVSFNVRFDNKINYPLNGELVGGVIQLNGQYIKPGHFSYVNGVLTVWNKVNVTGLRQEFDIKGMLTFSGYSREITCEFSDKTTIGSDTLPAMLNDVNVVTTDGILTFSFVTSLRNGKLPVSVKLVNVVSTVNLIDDGLINASFIYTPDSGNTMLAVSRVVSPDKKLDYAVTLQLSINDGINEETQLVRLNHTQDYALTTTTQYLGNTYKDSTLTLRHRISSNKGIPSEISLVNTPKLTGCSNFSNFNYDKKEGLLSYTVWMPYLGGVQEFSVDVDFTIPGLNHPDTLTTGKVKYVPAGTATHYNHYFNDDGSLTCLWVFRDAMGKIPKLIRIEDFWKYNINICARAVNLTYDPLTGIGSVTVNPVTDESKFYAETTFKFPSPDVNFYPLRIDIKK